MTEPLSSGAAGRKPPAWLQCVAACALAFAIGIAPAVADGIPNAHEGGQGADKPRATLVDEDRSSGAGTAHATATIAKPPAVPAAPGTLPEEPPAVAAPAQPADPMAPEQPAESPAPTQPPEQPAVVDVAPEEDSAQAWTRTTSRTVVTPRGIIRSVTRSFSYATDEEGNLARAKAVAIARAPNDAAAVENGAGRVVAKTSVDVTGNGAASADAGGSIAVNDGRVEVSTWGRTSAEVF